jgi:hypothetical protein
MSARDNPGQCGYVGGRTRLPLTPVLHFWSPHLDPAHPQDCTHPERYAIQVQASSAYLAIAADQQSLLEVSDVRQAHLFHAHEAALRVAKELNAEGRGPVDVVKVEWDPA